jgi:hypothetical protein
MGCAIVDRYDIVIVMLPVVRILGTGMVARSSALLLGTILFAGCSLKSAKDDAHLSLVMANPHRLGLSEGSS